MLFRSLVKLSRFRDVATHPAVSQAQILLLPMSCLGVLPRFHIRVSVLPGCKSADRGSHAAIRQARVPGSRQSRASRTTPGRYSAQPPQIAILATRNSPPAFPKNNPRPTPTTFVPARLKVPVPIDVDAAKPSCTVQRYTGCLCPVITGRCPPVGAPNRQCNS